MAKILLVEDDKSLREIYSIRLTAEGYEVVTAGDGEEALALAVKERPDLILSDVMMPKISGFDMLDILRSTPETKEMKVVMMTALSSEDQRERGENLGADRYLVKSQVGVEDVVNTIHEVIDDLSTPVPLDAPSGGVEQVATVPQDDTQASSVSSVQDVNSVQQGVVTDTLSQPAATAQRATVVDVSSQQAASIDASGQESAQSVVGQTAQPQQDISQFAPVDTPISVQPSTQGQQVSTT